MGLPDDWWASDSHLRKLNVVEKIMWVRVYGAILVFGTLMGFLLGTLLVHIIGV